MMIIACGSEVLHGSPTPDNPTKALSGGETTVFDATSHAFSTPAPNLSMEGLAEHLVGDREFEAVFVTVPAEVNPGLGPVYNNISCINCHARDGRGRAPTSGEKFTSMLFRVSLPNPNGEGTGAPVPVPDEVFLSHSSADRAFTARLARVLREHGVPVWYSDTNIRGAQQWHDETGAALRRCDWLVVALTPPDSGGCGIEVG